MKGNRMNNITFVIPFYGKVHGPTVTLVRIAIQILIQLG